MSRLYQKNVQQEQDTLDDPSLISHIRMLEENFAGRPKDNNWYL